jgi:hemerythrin-like metal-binding protein
VKSIYEQHFRVFELANNLYDAIKSGRKSEAIVDTFRGLVEYVQVHFTYEEKLLENNDYPFNQFIKHKQQHHDLIEQIKELYLKAKSGSAVISLEMLNFLRDWIMGHIAESDMKYKKFFNDKGIY